MEIADSTDNAQFSLSLTDGRLVRVHELCLGHLSGQHLKGVVIGGTGGLALAVGLSDMLDIERRLVDDVCCLLDAFQLLWVADGCLGWVAWHVEGHTPAVLKWNEI